MLHAAFGQTREYCPPDSRLWTGGQRSTRKVGFTLHTRAQNQCSKGDSLPLLASVVARQSSPRRTPHPLSRSLDCRPRPARSLVPHRSLCRRTGRCRRPNHLVRSRLGRPRSTLSQSSRPRLVGSERAIGRMRRNPSLRRGGAPCRSVRVRRFRSGCARLPSPPKLLPLLLLPVRRHSWRLRRGLVYFSGIAAAPCRWRRRSLWTSFVRSFVAAATARFSVSGLDAARPTATRSLHPPRPSPGPSSCCRCSS